MSLLILVVDDEPDVEVLFRQQFRRDLTKTRNRGNDLSHHQTHPRRAIIPPGAMRWLGAELHPCGPARGSRRGRQNYR